MESYPIRVVPSSDVCFLKTDAPLNFKLIYAYNADIILSCRTGRFLLTKMDDPDTAEEILKRAVQLDDKSEVALFNLGKLFHRYEIGLSVCFYSSNSY